jgi:dipeptidyl aminopeptidase/acylaminoacyl peptidase
MWRLVIATLLVSRVLQAAAQVPATPHTGPLLLDEALSVREFADRQPADLSPDGTLVAFVLQDSHRRAMLAEEDPSLYFTKRGTNDDLLGTAVWLTDTRSGTTRNLTGDGSSSWGPVWSPDGSRLAFYSDRDGVARLWIWERARNVLRRVSDAVVRPFFGFETVQWTPDGRRLLVKLLPSRLTLATARDLLPQPSADAVAAMRERHGKATAVVFSSEAERARSDTSRANPADIGRSFHNASLADLALVDVATGRVSRIVRETRAMAYRFSPDGRWIAFGSRHPIAPDGRVVYGLYDIELVDTAGKNRRMLAPTTAQEYGTSFSWSPDGARLAYGSGSELHVASLDGGAPLQRFVREGVRLGHEYRGPLWLDSATILVAAANAVWRVRLTGDVVERVAETADRTILELIGTPRQGIPRAGEEPLVLLATRDPATMRAGFHRLDLGTGSAEPLFQDAIGLGNLTFEVDVSLDGRAFVFTAESAERPSEVWYAAGDLRTPRRLTELNPQVTERKLGRSRLVEWRAPSGDTLRGALLLPPDYEEGRRYPTIVKVYGGSRLSSSVNRFGLQPGVDNMHLLSTRGYAVLLTDAPVRPGTPMADIGDAVNSAVDNLVSSGIADSTRLGIIGHSHGGYSVLSALVQTTRFRAAMSSAGTSNLLSHYTTLRADGSAFAIEWAEQGQGAMETHPWAARDRYIANSPFFHLDRVTTPVLLIHGGDDRTVLPTRAEETFVALRRLGKTVTLVRYEGEEHHQAQWTRANAKDYWERVWAWFERFIGPRRSP